VASILALVAGETFGEPIIIILGFAITLAYVLVILIIPYLRHNSFTRWIAFLGILDIGWWIYVIFIVK
ncbi:MAG: hypothetical protein IJS43_04905, partial [Bacteroidaceae bacterium]|nr:hypothetical protein [Bacteroidaceae bacterium]